jgi:DNA-binding PadR family transcriptional regulator
MFCNYHDYRRARMMRHRFGGWEGFGASPYRSSRGWGRRRVLDQGDLRLLILRRIETKPAHGYEIIKAIEEQFAGVYSPSPGVVYPTLTLLEEMGYARVDQTDGSKKLYAATEEGRKYLADNKETLDKLDARLAEFGEAVGGGPSPQVLRAMENLRMALRMRMARSLTPEQARAIAAALDAATVQIERE